MNQKKRKKSAGKTVLVIFLVLLALAAAGVAAFFIVDFILGRQPGPKPVPYFAEGDVRAYRVAAPEGVADAAALEAFYGEALSYGEENGFNTMIFEAKPDGVVYWRDKTFPAPQWVTEQDTFFTEYDPLTPLFRAAEGKNIQIWLEVDPFDGGGVTGEMSGAAVVETKGKTAAMLAKDSAYNDLLAGSIAALGDKYPLAGVVFPARAADGDDMNAAAWQQGFSALAGRLSDALAKAGSHTLVTLAFDEDGTLVSPAYASELVSTGKVDYLLTPVSPGQSLSARLDMLGPLENCLIVRDVAVDTSAVVLFTASAKDSFAGAMLADWPDAKPEAARLGFLESAFTQVEGTLPAGFDIPRRLQVNYPLEADAIGSGQESVFVMGNSDPSQPLLLDGVEIQRTSTDGVFGVLVNLAPGDNTFTFSQGAELVTHTITRPEPVAGGGGGGGEYPHDNTQPAPAGQAVQVVGVFTGGLTDPASDGNINETYYSGSVGIVRESVETVRYMSAVGDYRRTEAYRLTNGDYVMAYNCTWVSGGQSAFTGLTAQPDDRGEWLKFEGEGTPVAEISDADGVLRVEMCDTSFTLPDGFSSSIVKSATVEPIENGVALCLNVGDGLWGWSVDYSDGGTRLFLKRPPTLSGDPAKPLAGVRVMLDPGHGADDKGAPGIMGAASGPNEKDCNLAQAQAIAYRLRQLGAEVIMGRDDDSFTTTHERLAALIEAKPDFFISVHHNSAELNGDRNNVSGAEVYFYVPAAYGAPCSSAFGQSLLDCVAAETGREGGEAAWGYYNVLRTPVCPAVLFEFGYMVNPAEFENITSTDGLYEAACGVAEGLLHMVPQSGEALPTVPVPADGAAPPTDEPESDALPAASDGPSLSQMA